MPTLSTLCITGKLEKESDLFTWQQINKNVVQDLTSDLFNVQ